MLEEAVRLSPLAVRRQAALGKLALENEDFESASKAFRHAVNQGQSSRYKDAENNLGLVQALTSVQEMTLTFVPKLGAIFAVFWITMSFSGATIVRFYQDQIIPMIVGP